MLDPLSLVRAIATLATVIVLGSSVLIWYTRDALVPAGGSVWRRRVVLSVLIASFAGAVAACLFAAGTAATAAGISFFSIDAAVLVTFLTKTGVGRITIFELACAIAACVPAVIAWVTLKKSRASDRALLAAAVIAGVGLSAYPFNSHPVTLDQQTAGLIASIAHRLALGIWLGGLPALVLLIGAGPVPDVSRQLAAVVLRRFSQLATAAMIVILVSGTLLTWFIVRNFPAFVGTGYGRLLILKLALLAGVIVIARGLQRKLLPALEAKPSDSIFRNYAGRVKLESLLAVLMVVVASEMAQMAPPEHENIVWLLPFRFSFAATWATPFVPARFIGGTVLILAGLAVLLFFLWPSLRPAWVRLRANTSLATGVAAVLAGSAIAFPAISVEAYRDTYLTTDIPYAVTSITAGLNHYEQNCTSCHGTSGHGDGPVAASLTVKPADLSAPHTALHTAGDIYWWLTHGIPASGMPGYDGLIKSEDRWDIINFLGAFAVGYQARVIETKIHPGQQWLGPPDFQVTSESDVTSLLSDYRRKTAVLVVLFSCVQDNIPGETKRLEQLLAARERLAALGAKIVLVAPGETCEPLRKLAAGKILIADRDTADVATSLGLFTRTFLNRRQNEVRVSPMHAEFLIDRSGYIRARWLPEEDNSWSDLGFIEPQVTLQAREPLAPPPPDVHSQH
ncbi:MAG: CopD family protein [Beijerinckiaceae bacterium]|nr:CopD family protein [Beijerinckiaceae bacterium]MCI0735197.1 CopD family protein [Beijerinckiaceae bacterium]